MNKKLKLSDFHIIGIEARTNNATEMGPNGVISKLWAKFMTGNMLASIPNRADGSIIAGYTDYQSNKDGEYTFVIGTRVTAINEVPPGMVVKHVPAGDYLVLTSSKGPIGEVVYAVWKEIWTMPESTRAYKFDYEVYDSRAFDSNNAEVDVFLGLNV